MSANSEESSAGRKRARVPRQKKAEAWKYFEISVGEDLKHVLTCTVCGFAYSKIENLSTYGTSNLNRHLSSKHPDINVNEAEGGSYAPIDQDVYREKLSIAMTRHNYPFTFVEHEATRDLLKYLNSGVEHITRNTAKADMLKLYRKEKGKLKHKLEGVRSRICLTSDIWSNPCNEGYMTLTAHYIDEDWILQKKVLNFRHVPPPHNGIFVGEALIDFLKDWGIDRKIFSITLDNAGYNSGVVEMLKSHLLLKGALVCEGDFVRVRCIAHILHLIVKEGLKMSEFVIGKVRECVQYIKWEKRRVAFEELVRQFSSPVGGGKICSDVSTRWNSTYLMLESALQHKKAFSQMALVDSNFKCCPTEDEWNEVEKCAKFLKPFYETTLLFSGCKYPTSNLYFLNMWKIKMVIKEKLASEDDFLSSMALEMMIKFEKYWEMDSAIFSLALVLDPRYKFKGLSYCFSKLNHTREEIDKLVASIRGKLYLLFEDYKNDSSQPPQSEVAPNVGENMDDFEDFESYQVEYHEPSSNKSQLDLYLEEKLMDRKLDLNVMNYWKGNTLRYPELSMMARDILSVPITSVASESAFSIGGQLFGKYRNSLLSSNAEALLCTRDWLNATKYDDDEDSLVDDSDNFGVASNPSTSSNM